MRTTLTHTTVYVLDQDAARAFYTDKLGFEVADDVSMGEEFEGAGAGFRWLTVSPPEQPEIRFILADVAMGHDAATTTQLRELIAKGTFGAGVLETNDCRKAYELLSARGVAFLQEPIERPYGVEAVFRDDSGNWFSLSEQAH